MTEYEKLTVELLAGILRAQALLVENATPRDGSSLLSREMGHFRKDADRLQDIVKAALSPGRK